MEINAGDSTTLGADLSLKQHACSATRRLCGVGAAKHFSGSTVLVASPAHYLVVLQDRGSAELPVSQWD